MSFEKVRGLNGDSEKEIGELIKKYDRDPSLHNGRSLSKRLLRGLYSLTMYRENEWLDEIDSQSKVTSIYFPLLSEQINTLVSVISDKDEPDKLFKSDSSKLYRFILINSAMTIINIREEKQYIPQVSEWIYNEFISGKIPDVSQQKIEEAIEKRQSDVIPMTFIAKIGSCCIGTISLFKNDLHERTDLSPWLAALYVSKEWRGIGLGTLLIECIERITVKAGYNKLYLRTEEAAEYYSKLCWTQIDSLVDEYGQGVKVFGKELKGIHQKIYHNHNLNLKGSCSRRDAVRAVISQNNKYLLIYSSQKGDYKFPGGGVEPGESFNQALEREVLEESGYRITEIGTQIALISEFSESREEELDYFQMDSHYFHCTIDLGEKLELNLDKYELDLNFEPLWISLEEAISANKKVMNGRAESPSWTERETFFLEYLTKSD